MHASHACLFVCKDKYMFTHARTHTHTHRQAVQVCSAMLLAQKAVCENDHINRSDR